MGRASVYLWASLAGATILLFAGAWLGLSALARSFDSGPEHAVAAAAQARHARHLAPAHVCPGAESLDAPVSTQQETAICLLNYARRVEGLPELPPSPLLMRSAELKAADIVRCAEFAHDACGRDVRKPFSEAGYFRTDVDVAFGENLAWGAADAGTPRGAVLGWLDSAEHRANLFKSEWREQGIALVYAGDFLGVGDSRIWVSHFGRQG